jgi:hypothetical protein
MKLSRLEYAHLYLGYFVHAFGQVLILWIFGGSRDIILLLLFLFLVWYEWFVFLPLIRKQMGQ